MLYSENNLNSSQFPGDSADKLTFINVDILSKFCIFFQILEEIVVISEKINNILKNNYIIRP